MTTAKAVRPTPLAIDIGGTGLKVSVLSRTGKLLTDWVRIRAK